MKFERIDDVVQEKLPFTSLLYCPPGVGKSTAIGLIAQASKGNTLVLDVDRTMERTIAKKEIVKDSSRMFTIKIDNINTFDDWSNVLKELGNMKENGKLDFENIAVDNISELERCILSDLGSKGKNKGVPAQADYDKLSDLSETELNNTSLIIKLEENYEGQ